MVVEKEVFQAIERRLSENACLPDMEAVLRRVRTERLKVYWGIDPTNTDVHLGHVIALLLLKNLAKAGHEIIVLIGDFTAQVGDPTGKLSVRKKLTEKEIRKYMKGYVEQITRVLPRDSFRLEKNSTWLKKLKLSKLIEFASMMSVQQMLERDMFQERIKREEPIFINEFLYPLLQGYDSIYLDVDAEVGGQEQLFNMKVGRDLASKISGKNKMVIGNKLLEDAEGHKMSKSEGNVIAILDTPQEIRRKILAIGDGVVRSVFELCTEFPNEKIEDLFSGNKNPRELKEMLADELVRMFHGEGAVGEAQRSVLIHNTGPLFEVLAASGATASTSVARRLINQGAVEVDGEVVKEWKFPVERGAKIQVGKGKFLEVK